MNFLPKTSGTRPRLSVEVRAEGIVAARAEDAAAVLSAVSRSRLARGALLPGLRLGNLVDRQAVVAGLRKTLDAVVDKSRGRQATLIVPDASVRVLLLDFDTLPSKAAEALPVVRFRLKKLLPFEADDAAVSYQIMSSSKTSVHVLAVAMPREVLAEYEEAVHEAGFEPGAVLPSTLSALAGLEVSDSASLVVNAGPRSVTTAIVRNGVVLLHRSLDMSADPPPSDPVVTVPAVAGEIVTSGMVVEQSLVIEDVREELRELAQTANAREVVQAVSVAAAYFEDTLGFPPAEILSAGTTSAEHLGAMLREAEFGTPELRVREIVDAGMVMTTSATPHCWLAGVRGALKS